MAQTPCLDEYIHKIIYVQIHMYVCIYIYIHVYIHMGMSQGVCHTHLSRVYICMDCGIAQRMYVHWVWVRGRMYYYVYVYYCWFVGKYIMYIMLCKYMCIECWVVGEDIM